MDLYKEDLRQFLRTEFEKAKTNGFQNIEIVNDYMNGIPILPQQFYSLVFSLAKEEIHYPYVIHHILERGTTIIVLIQFIQNLQSVKIETSVSYK
jgi:hypothetical protein